MAQILKDEPQSNYLRLSLEGDWDNDTIGKTSEQILDLCKKHQARRVLFDVRNLHGNPSVLERFNMATQFSLKYMKCLLGGEIQSSRFAVIGNHPLVDPHRFEETVSVNKGLPVKTFTDLDQALAWLLRD
ncbi:MAG TPA: STAS/SEC14 domain-containing protein [bacterium]|nr:STAS/SEC14 domain-containing protein [bacterium]